MHCECSVYVLRDLTILKYNVSIVHLTFTVAADGANAQHWKNDAESPLHAPLEPTSLA